VYKQHYTALLNYNGRSVIMVDDSVEGADGAANDIKMQISGEGAPIRID
jgi:hypothetical protein